MDNDVRVSFLPNVNGDKGKDNFLNKLVLAALHQLPSERATNYVLSLLKDDSAVNALKAGQTLDIPVSNSRNLYTLWYSAFLILQSEVSANVEAQELSLKMLRVYCQRVLTLKAGERTVVGNGRVLGPFDPEENFTVEDFQLLERFSSSSYLEKINIPLENTTEDENGMLYIILLPLLLITLKII